MLPYDNKSELEIVLDMPEDSSLERTAQVAREIAAALRQEKEVTDYQIYVGTAAPHGFNGLMRHYYLRRSSSLAEVQINLLPRNVVRYRATRSPSGSGPRWRRSPLATVHGLRWPRSRRARR